MDDSKINYIHKDLAAGRWFELSLPEQLGNVGSEVGRATRYHRDGQLERRNRALDRALELLDLTISDLRWRGPRLQEICRAREVLADTFFGDNQYHDSPEALEKYFSHFAILARRNRWHKDIAKEI